MTVPSEIQEIAIVIARAQKYGRRWLIVQDSEGAYWLIDREAANLARPVNFYDQWNYTIH